MYFSFMKEGEWIDFNNEKLTWENWAKKEPKQKSPDQDCGVLEAQKDSNIVEFKASLCNTNARALCVFKTKEIFQLRKFKSDRY